MSSVRKGYDFKATAEDLEFAEEKFGENEEVRKSLLTSVRDWVSKQNFVCPTNDLFLLSFLRRCNFNESKAKEMLEEYVRHRTSASYKAYYINDGVVDDAVKDIIKSGACSVLPGTDKYHMPTVIYRASKFDYKKYPVADVFRALTYNLDLLSLGPLSSIYGFRAITDWGNVPLGYYSIISPTVIDATAQLFFKNPVLPINFCHCANVPIVVAGMIYSMKQLMSTQLASKISYDRGVANSIFAHWDKQVLPNELGGEAGALDQQSQEWMDYVLQHEDHTKLLVFSSPDNEA